MSWETVSIIGMAVGAVMGVLSLALGFIVTMSFIRRIKARPAKGKAKTKEKAADEGYSKKDQSLLAEMAERLSVLEADVTLKLDNFHRRLLGLTRGRQDSEGRGPRRGGDNSDERAGGDPEWERVDPADPDVAAQLATGDFTALGDATGGDVAPAVAENSPLPPGPGATKEERLAYVRFRGPARRL